MRRKTMDDTSQAQILPIIVAWLSIIACVSVSAADLVITNARVFTATGADVIERGNVVIAGERIESITSGPVDTAGATVIDATGKMVMPGLIDAHLHAFFSLPSLDGTVTDIIFPRSDAEARAYIRGPLQKKLIAYLEQGFTSLLSVIDFWPYILDVRNQLATGDLRGPRLFAAGGVFIPLGNHYICGGNAWCDEHTAVYISTAAQARDWVQRYADSGVDLLVHDSLSNPPRLSPTVLKALIDAAHERNLKVFLTQSDATNVVELVAAGIDGFLHPPKRTADYDGSLVAPAAVRHLPVAITIGSYEEMYRLGNASVDQLRSYRIRRQNILKLLELGAIPVFGSDLGDKPGTTPRDIIRIVTTAMTGVGLTREQVLQAATRNAAQVLLGQHDLGTLEPGSFADIIIVDGDPIIDLNALANVEIVIKGGEVVVDKRR
jgi:imidazolonepropionase-like amidohydrolase